MRTVLTAGVSVAAAFLLILAILWADGYQLYIIALVGLTAMVGVGLNVLLGLTGQISLGHVGFYAIGAYTGAILTTNFGWNFWVALPAAAFTAGCAGVLLAIPALRVSGPYLAMVTIAFGFVVEQGAAEWQGLTGGWNGMVGIPTPSAFGYRFDQQAITFMVVAITAILFVLFARFRGGTWGMAMQAVRDSEVAGRSLGLNPVSIRTIAFMLSAVVTGIAGAIFASMASFISPESFPFSQSIMFLLVVMIGGAGTVLGPLIGALVVVLLPELLATLAEYRLLFVGILLLVVLRLAPEGIVGSVAKRFRRRALESTRPSAAGMDAFLAKQAAGRELRADGLSVSFGGVNAVAGVSFVARPGEVTSIIGPNGAGKTTVLNLLGGFYKPTAGAVRLGEQEIGGLPSHAVARRGVARTYQTTQLFERMSVIDNLLVAFQRGRIGSVLAAFRRTGRSASSRADAEGLLNFVGYKGPVDIPAGSLSHIDKRLVEIARALAAQPQVLLLDEPAAGLGREDTEELGALLRRIANAGLVVILVEHDMDLVMTFSDHVVVLDAGVSIADGTPSAVKTNSAVLAAYLGEGAIEGRARAPGWTRGPETTLDVRGLSAGYGAAPVLQQTAISVRGGELVTVLGANGAGKSTLMRALSGLHRPVQGHILLIGKEIQPLAAHQIAHAGLVLVPEGRQVFPELSVVDNIRLGGFSRADFDAEKEVEQMLDRFPALRKRRDSRAGLLSGGEQQMLAIARGLVAKPKILLLDEPSLGLAPGLINQLYALLADLRDEGTTILLVDQMAAMALSIADRSYVMASGRVVHEGAAGEVEKDSALQRAYLG